MAAKLANTQVYQCALSKNAYLTVLKYFSN